MEMTIALEKRRWMPVRQASRLTERQDKEEVDNMRFLGRTQFGKMLLLLPCTEAFEIIPPEKEARRLSRSSLLRKTRRSGSQRRESAGAQRRQ